MGRGQCLVNTLAHVAPRIKISEVSGGEGPSHAHAHGDERQCSNSHDDAGRPLEHREQTETNDDSKNAGNSVDQGLLESIAHVVDIGGVPAHERGAMKPIEATTLVVEQATEDTYLEQARGFDREEMTAHMREVADAELDHDQGKERADGCQIPDRVLKELLHGERNKRLTGKHDAQSKGCQEQSGPERTEIRPIPGDHRRECPLTTAFIRLMVRRLRNRHVPSRWSERLFSDAGGVVRNKGSRIIRGALWSILSRFIGPAGYGAFTLSQKSPKSRIDV